MTVMVPGAAQRKDRLLICLWPTVARCRSQSSICSADPEGIVNIDAKIAYCNFEFGVTEQELDCSEVACPFVNLRRLGLLWNG